MVLVLEELTYEEIATALGLSVSNVGVRVNRAKTQLRERLNHD
jgi:DNA-directed RNA polymerase specialized sigma24 family protein